MKAYFKHLSKAAMMIVMLLMVTACGDDDNDSPMPDSNTGQTPTEMKKNLIGTWKSSTGSNTYEVYIFKTDGTAKYYNFTGSTKNKEIDYAYTFDTSSMQITLSSNDESKQKKVSSITSDRLIMDGVTFLKVDNWNPEDPDNNNNGNNQQNGKRGPVATAFRGSGTEGDPYILSDATELRKLADDVNSGMTYRDAFFKMTADITINKNVLNADGSLNGNGSNFEQWIPIGIDLEHVFCGTFDGNKHKISGLFIKKEESDTLGLFGVFSGHIKNLKIEDSYIEGKKNIGSVAGIATATKINNKYYGVTIENIVTSTTLVGGMHMGGIVGWLRAIDISGTPPDYFVSNCANKGLIFCDHNTVRIGGIIGCLYQTSKHNKFFVSNCINYGDIKAANSDGLGGVVGHISLGGSGSGEAHILNCANFGNLSEPARSGGIVGMVGLEQYKILTIKNSVNYGMNSSNNNSGAIVGYLTTNGTKTINNNYYLETSCPRSVGAGGNWSTTNYNYSMTATQMKAQSFLNTLNTNATTLGSEYGKWTFGSDGFPTLQWVLNF